MDRNWLPATQSSNQSRSCIRIVGLALGGWLLSQMEVAGGVFAAKATKIAHRRAMNFRKLVYVGDLVSVYATLVRIGRTLGWIDDQGKPQAIARDGAPVTAWVSRPCLHGEAKAWGQVHRNRHYRIAARASHAQLSVGDEWKFAYR